MTEAERRRLRLGRLETLSALAGGVTHEMSNLAASVMMSVQLLEPSCQQPVDRQVLASLEELSHRLQHAGRQLHWLARGIDGEPTLFQPQYLLSDLQRLARIAFPAEIAVITRYPPDLWPLAADPLVVYQLLLALCLEARYQLNGAGTLVLGAGNQEPAHPEGLAGAAAADAAGAGADTAGAGAGNRRAGRFVVLEGFAEAEAAPQPEPAAGAAALASARRAAAHAKRAAAAAGGFTAPLPAGSTGRGRRAYLPAAPLDDLPT
jgi:hypothetical protein